MKRMWLALPFLIFVGCGGGSKTDTSALPQDPAGTRTVTGSLISEYIHASGVSLRPTDLRDYSIRALVPDANGGYTAYPGTGAADGTFAIRAVPNGGYFLQLSANGSNYTTHRWTSLSQIHLGGYSQGRTDWKLANSGTSLEIIPVVPMDIKRAELTVPSLAMVRPLYFSSAQSLWSIPFASNPLPEQGRDAGYFVALHPVLSENTEATQIITSALSLPAAGLTNGAATRIQAVLEPQFSNAALDVRFDAGAFQAAINDVDTPVESRPLSVTLKTQPYGGTVAPLAAATLLEHQNFETAGIAQRTGLAYANPYPLDWSKVLTVQRSFSKRYGLPGFSGTANFRFSTSVTFSSSGIPVSPLTPLISPVRNLKVNGLSAAQTNLSVGTSPLFTWEAPSVGIPTYYYIYVYKIDPIGTNGIKTSTIAFFSTTQNRLQVPSGILAAGGSYAALVTAAYQGHYDPAHPSRLGFPFAKADNITELFVP